MQPAFESPRHFSFEMNSDRDRFAVLDSKELSNGFRKLHFKAVVQCKDRSSRMDV